MSRSYHQKHGTSHILGLREEYENSKDGDSWRMISQGKDRIIWRKNKTKPYGLKPFTGYGGETYAPKYGEWIEPIINKKRVRRLLKQETKDELDDIERERYEREQELIEDSPLVDDFLRETRKRIERDLEMIQYLRYVYISQDSLTTLEKELTNFLNKTKNENL